LGQDDERDAWSYNGSSSRAPLLHIEFTSLNTHTITASAGYGGSISPPGQVTVLDGDSETFSIIPDPGNSIHDVLVDGIPQGALASYAFTNVTTNHYITAVFNLPAECSDLSSVPLSAIKHAAPANIMFMLDDSGSMDWEFLTEENDGKFQNYQYVFNNPGDNVFGDDSVISEIDRKKWKSQWSGYNKLYYDPSVDYEPWPTLDNADPDTPRSHPVNETPMFTLNATYYLFDRSIIVDNLDGPPTYTETGTWGESIFEPEYNGSARWTDTVESTATFTPALPETGTYEVYAWWNCFTNRDQYAKITITYDGGTDIIYRNQRANVDNVPECLNPLDPTSPCCGHWISLGTYSFAAGTAGSVTIERHADDPNPSNGTTIADATKFVSTGVASVDIRNAHYYTFDDTNENGGYDTGEPVYLVVIEGTSGTYNIHYYAATVTGSGATEEVTNLVEVTAPSIPASVESTRTPAEERQNFANWYSFYRRRVLTATVAVANAIVNMQGVNVGMYSINNSLIQPVLSVKASGEDHTATLLDSLYNLTLVGDT
jgi:type IV pilus assembly protein PilY1